MTLSLVHSAEPERDIKDSRFPCSIDAIMRGPHLTELVTDDTVPAIVVEPLRFIPPMRLNGRDVFPGPAA